jgi:indoleamine 2,3-dioxygenase
MSPHKVDLLPSPLALASYGISENGFLPAEAPLRRLPHAFYEPWERLMDQLPSLLRAGCVRKHVDALPVLGTYRLDNERELQRVYSMLAMVAQAYIWQGPKPSEVSEACSSLSISICLTDNSDYLQRFLYPSYKLRKPWTSFRSPHTQR